MKSNKKKYYVRATFPSVSQSIAGFIIEATSETEAIEEARKEASEMLIMEVRQTYEIN